MLRTPAMGKGQGAAVDAHFQPYSGLDLHVSKFTLLLCSYRPSSLIPLVWAL